MKRSEHNSIEHSQRQDTLTDFNTWLASSQEAFTQSSGLLGDKPTLLDRAKTLKQLMSNKSTGQNLLQALDHKTSKTLSNTAASGHEVLRQDVQTAQGGLEELVTSLSLQHQELQQCLLLWDEFDDQCTQVAQDLKEAEAILDREPELMPDAKQKEQQLEKYKVSGQGILSSRVQGHFHFAKATFSGKYESLWETFEGTPRPRPGVDFTKS